MDTLCSTVIAWNVKIGAHGAYINIHQHTVKLLQSCCQAKNSEESLISKGVNKMGLILLGCKYMYMYWEKCVIDS